VLGLNPRGILGDHKVRARLQDDPLGERVVDAVGEIPPAEIHRKSAPVVQLNVLQRLVVRIAHRARAGVVHDLGEDNVLDVRGAGAYGRGKRHRENCIPQP